MNRELQNDNSHIFNGIFVPLRGLNSTHYNFIQSMILILSLSILDLTYKTNSACRMVQLFSV